MAAIPDTIVVVSGAPGSGKTSVARHLAAALGFPLLVADDIKEALADSLGLGDEAWSLRLGAASREVLVRLLATVPSAVVEGWWKEDWPDRLRALERPMLEIFCRCDPDVLEQRVRERAHSERHPIHRDVMRPELAEEMSDTAATVEPLRLGGPLLIVDTTGPGEVDIADIVQWVNDERPRGCDRSPREGTDPSPPA